MFNIEGTSAPLNRLAQYNGEIYQSADRILAFRKQGTILKAYQLTSTGSSDMELLSGYATLRWEETLPEFTRILGRDNGLYQAFVAPYKGGASTSPFIVVYTNFNKWYYEFVGITMLAPKEMALTSGGYVGWNLSTGSLFLYSGRDISDSFRVTQVLSNIEKLSYISICKEGFVTVIAEINGKSKAYLFHPVSSVPISEIKIPKTTSGDPFSDRSISVHNTNTDELLYLEEGALELTAKLFKATHIIGDILVALFDHTFVTRTDSSITFYQVSKNGAPWKHGDFAISNCEYLGRSGNILYLTTDTNLYMVSVSLDEFPQIAAEPIYNIYENPFIDGKLETHFEDWVPSSLSDPNWKEVQLKAYWNPTKEFNYMRSFVLSGESPDATGLISHSYKGKLPVKAGAIHNNFSVIPGSIPVGDLGWQTACSSRNSTDSRLHLDTTIAGPLLKEVGTPGYSGEVNLSRGEAITLKVLSGGHTVAFSEIASVKMLDSGGVEVSTKYTSAIETTAGSFCTDNPEPNSYLCSIESPQTVSLVSVKGRYRLILANNMQRVSIQLNQLPEITTWFISLKNSLGFSVGLAENVNIPGEAYSAPNSLWDDILIRRDSPVRYKSDDTFPGKGILPPVNTIFKVFDIAPPVPEKLCSSEELDYSWSEGSFIGEIPSSLPKAWISGGLPNIVVAKQAYYSESGAHEHTVHEGSDPYHRIYPIENSVIYSSFNVLIQGPSEVFANVPVTINTPVYKTTQEIRVSPENKTYMELVTSSIGQFRSNELIYFYLPHAENHTGDFPTGNSFNFPISSLRYYPNKVQVILEALPEERLSSIGEVSWNESEENSLEDTNSYQDIIAAKIQAGLGVVGIQCEIVPVGAANPKYRDYNPMIQSGDSAGDPGAQLKAASGVSPIYQLFEIPCGETHMKTSYSSTLSKKSRSESEIIYGKTYIPAWLDINNTQTFWLKSLCSTHLSTASAKIVTYNHTIGEFLETEYSEEAYNVFAERKPLYPNKPKLLSEYLKYILNKENSSIKIAVPYLPGCSDFTESDITLIIRKLIETDSTLLFNPVVINNPGGYASLYRAASSIQTSLLVSSLSIEDLESNARLSGLTISSGNSSSTGGLCDYTGLSEEAPLIGIPSSNGFSPYNVTGTSPNLKLGPSKISYGAPWFSYKSSLVSADAKYMVFWGTGSPFVDLILEKYIAGAWQTVSRGSYLYKHVNALSGVIKGSFKIPTDYSYISSSRAMLMDLQPGLPCMGSWSNWLTSRAIPSGVSPAMFTHINNSKDILKSGPLPLVPIIGNMHGYPVNAASPLRLPIVARFSALEGVYPEGVYRVSSYITLPGKRPTQSKLTPMKVVPYMGGSFGTPNIVSGTREDFITNASGYEEGTSTPLTIVYQGVTLLHESNYMPTGLEGTSITGSTGQLYAKHLLEFTLDESGSVSV